jgi:hypothetical protein
MVTINYLLGCKLIKITNFTCIRCIFDIVLRIYTHIRNESKLDKRRSTAILHPLSDEPTRLSVQEALP